MHHENRQSKRKSTHSTVPCIPFFEQKTDYNSNGPDSRNRHTIK